jgi:hypothetical protein
MQDLQPKKPQSKRLRLCSPRFMKEMPAGSVFVLTSQLCIAAQAALQRWTAMLSIDVTLPKNSSNADC